MSDGGMRGTQQGSRFAMVWPEQAQALRGASGGTWAVYMALRILAGGAEEWWVPGGLSAIADQAGVKRRTARRALGELVERGLLTRHERSREDGGDDTPQWGIVRTPPGDSTVLPPGDEIVPPPGGEIVPPPGDETVPPPGDEIVPPQEKEEQEKRDRRRESGDEQTCGLGPEAQPPLSLTPPAPDEPDPVQVVWEAWRDAAQHHDEAARPRRRAPKAARTAIRARLREHSVDDLRRLMAWWAQGDDDRARFLRERGHGWATLLRPAHCADYADRARRWEAHRERQDRMTEEERMMAWARTLVGGGR